MSGKREKRHSRICKQCGSSFLISHAKCKTKFCGRKCFGESRRQDVKARFMKYIKVTESCWIWTSTKCPKGYGHFQLEGKATKAHRVALQMFKGVKLGGLHVLHSCDNTSCVNPDHLWAGTNLENVKDSEAKGRRFKKYSKELVDEAIRLWRKDKSFGSKTKIARKLGLSKDYVSQITTGKIRRIS